MKSFKDLSKEFRIQTMKKYGVSEDDDWKTPLTENERLCAIEIAGFEQALISIEVLIEEFKEEMNCGILGCETCATRNTIFKSFSKRRRNDI